MIQSITRFADKFIVSKVERVFLDRGIVPIWMRGAPLSNKISLVVPCYNVGKYINKFLSTVAAQTSGLGNLEVILVDDGSIDETGAIAQAWCKKYPDVIRYHRQENQGLCGARNTGLRLATGEWISFPDPDDFLHHRYLEKVDQAITEGKDKALSLICCNFIRYFEHSGRKRNDHGLSFRFKEGEKWLPASELNDFMQLAINSAFLRRSEMIKLDLLFDKRIVPGFEDANVVNRYLLHLPETTAAFLPDARYYYRKRADESSLQDTAKTRKEFYLNQPEYGWLPVLREAARLRGSVPTFIQRTVLYDTIGRFRTHLKRPHTLNILNDEEKLRYRNVMKEAFSFIEPDLINDTILPGLFEDLRVGILHLYYRRTRNTTTVYVTHYDKWKNLARISFCSGSASSNSAVWVEGRQIEKLHIKRVCNSFVGEEFFYEHACWIPMVKGKLAVTVDNKPAIIKIKGKTYLDGVTQEEILCEFSPEERKTFRNLTLQMLSSITAYRYRRCWLVMDRCDKADDNGEHFYRYLMTTQKEVNAFFVLQKNSPDWHRLKSEGFQLIEYRSAAHYGALLNAEFVISSHADRFIRHPFRDTKNSNLFRYRFLFIQHGVTKDNQSEWFNNIMPALLATATTDEFMSIAHECSDYHLSPKEVYLTGFPRHDALASGKLEKRSIFVMPTWREDLSGKVIKPGVRALRPDFSQSEYVKRWSSLLSSQRLREIADSNGLRLVFCPHPNLAEHVQDFNLPDYVSLVPSNQAQSLQPFFREMAVMVSDYSSVAFDAGFLDKPVVYYQFDGEQFFRGHIYRRGYFNYDRDGFGPVGRDERDVLHFIESAVSGNERSIYGERRKSTFPFRDGRSSQRLYEAIVSLDHVVGNLPNGVCEETTFAEPTVRTEQHEIADVRA